MGRSHKQVTTMQSKRLLVVTVLSLLLPKVTLSDKPECESHVICDTTKGLITALDVFDYETCQQMCQLSHDEVPSPLPSGCEFFTMWTRAGIKNDCYLLSECVPLEHAPGARSGIMECEKPEKKCTGGGSDIPVYNEKETLWSCDHESWAYGDKPIYPGVTCTASCPSFQGGHSVSTTCVFTDSAATWGPPDVAATTYNGTTVSNPELNPTVACGCVDLVIEGEVVMEDDNGLELKCTDPQPTIEDGKTTFSEDSECILLCDGVIAWDLYCDHGQWSVDLTTAKDVTCYGDGAVTLSTWFPPQPTSTTATETTNKTSLIN